MLDHLVYAVPHLPTAIDWFRANTGLEPQLGGRHPDHGTHNALLRLGETAYLEIVAVDPDNTTAPVPRWMGVDELDRPRLTRWCVAVPDLAVAADLLRAYDPAMGVRAPGQGQTPDGRYLRWEMLLPLPTPRTEVVPFCIDWSASDRHPTDGLPPAVDLIDLRLYHPDPGRVQPLIDALAPGRTVHAAARPLLVASIQTPKGVVML